MPTSPADPAVIVRDDRAGRWAPWWVLAYVAMWPLPGIAETVLGLLTVARSTPPRAWSCAACSAARTC